MPRANKELHSGQPQYGLNNSIPRIEGVASDVKQIETNEHIDIQQSKNTHAEFGLEQQTIQVGQIDTNLLMEYRAERRALEDKQTYIEKYQKIVSDWYDEFHKDDKKGDKFFRNTKVGSCRKVLFKNGLSLAISFKIRNQKGEPLANYKHTLKKLPKATSTYFHYFCKFNIHTFHHIFQ